MPIGRSRVFWLGPFVRYLQIMQGARVGFDSGDAMILTLGVSLEVGPGIRRESQRPNLYGAAPPAPEVRTVDREVFVCADGDKDEIPDKVDRCPDVVGSADNWGCPEYKKVVVKRDKLDLKEKLFFAWNQAVLQEVSYPVLDEVVQALKENKSFRVQVQGHSSAEGSPEHNQTLSEKRAQAVIDYLVAHGVDKERLTSKGLADTVPIDSNATVAGRENNRRVEFVVNTAIIEDGSK
jgi:outer membrane protein OmpA-like peptidoglycan-associated protein